ncbi:hypothetical protein TGVAND_267775 [Toxoplasma gondii VAND]|uniref:RAP domain-containing protein n=1 Tax=Toxoplasma gondii VAND TaxID=933077 RepID=A0A086PMS7_TOXGO|nr:hypothetical protein TGVAND_267775 [Toxoplasma gondii VAND]
MALASHRAPARQAATKALPSACSVSSFSASVRRAPEREWNLFPSPSPVLASRLSSQPRGQKTSSLQSSSPSLSSSSPPLSSSFCSLSFLSGRPSSTEKWIRRGDASLLFRALRRPQRPSQGGEVEGEKGSVCRRLRRRSLSASTLDTRFVKESLSGATSPQLDSAVRRNTCMQAPFALLSPLNARRFASLSSSLSSLSSSVSSPSASSFSDALSEESWEGRLLALRRLAEAEEGVRRGKAVVEFARGAQRGRRKSSSSALPFSVDAFASPDSSLADSESAGARLAAFLAALGEEQKLKSREEKLRLLVALARVRPQVLAEAPASAALLRSLVCDLLGGSGETQEESWAEADVTAKEVLVVLGCVRRLMNLPPFASPADRSYLRCCRLLREGRLASLSSSDLTKLLSLLAHPFQFANSSFTDEETSGGGAASRAREDAEEEDKEAEDAEALRRQLIVMALNVFSDRLEGASGSPPTLDDVASLLRAAALAGTHADVLRRVFACICAAAAPEGEASSLSPQASRQGNRLPAPRQRRSQKEKTQNTATQKVTPPQAVHLLHIMTTARLYSPEAIDALLSRFDVDESAPDALTSADAAPSPLSLLPIDGAPLNGGASPVVETILNAFVAKGEAGKKGWGVRTLGTRSELLRLLKIVELTLRLDLPHTCSQLSPPALRVLGVIRDTPFVDPKLMTDNVLSYQLAHFLRKHRFPCERSMEGPYALRLADIERRLVVLPVDATDEDPSRMCRHAASALDRSGEGAGDDGLQGEQRIAREEATKNLLDALRPETKARLTHLKELGWRVLVVHYRDWTAINSPLSKAKFVRSLLQRHGLIDLAPSGTGASR